MKILRVPLIKTLTVAVATLSLASTLTTRAVTTISGFVETPDSLSFNFTGRDFLDTIINSLPALSFWSFPGALGEVREEGFGQFAFALGPKHLADGSQVTVGDPLLNTFYGST